MKKAVARLWVAFFVLMPLTVLAQEEQATDIFYGNKDFKGVSGGYNYLLTSPGYVGSAEFYYLTRSKKSDQAKLWQNYYGVSLEFAYAQGTDFEFEAGEGDFDAWWGFLWIADRIYYQDDARVRPYVDFGAGLGIGQFTAQGTEQGNEFEIDWRSLDLVQLRLGVGAEFMLADNYALDLGVSGIGMAGYGARLLDVTDLEFAGAQAHIGISKWSEKK